MNENEVAQDLSLYKFYLELLIKAGAFIFGITGAMVSYFLANTTDQDYLKYSLILPLVMNLGFSTLCAFTAPSARRLNDEQPAYELVALPLLLWLFAVAYGIVTLGIAALLILIP